MKTEKPFPKILFEFPLEKDKKKKNMEVLLLLASST